MKILICHRPGGAFGFISDGWINALRDKGHIVQRWDNTQKSWDDFGPQLYIGCSGHRQNIPTDHGGCKIAIHVNPYGPVNVDGINENQDSISWVTSKSPDVVFGYGHDDDKLLWDYWTTKEGIKWVPMPTAGDKIVFKQLTNDKEYDIVYLGGHWAYKGKTIDSCLLPVLKSKSVSYKLYGWGDWPSNVCSGQLADDKACSFLNSGRIGPCISELHTHHWGIDIPERAFKVALCGTLIIHDQTTSIKRMIPSAIVSNSPAQFAELCYYYSKQEHADERIAITKKQQSEVLMSQTYHHRMATLLDSVGFNKESLEMIN